MNSLIPHSQALHVPLATDIIIVFVQHLTLTLTCAIQQRMNFVSYLFTKLSIHQW